MVIPEMDRFYAERPEYVKPSTEELIEKATKIAEKWGNRLAELHKLKELEASGLICGDCLYCKPYPLDTDPLHCVEATSIFHNNCFEDSSLKNCVVEKTKIICGEFKRLDAYDNYTCENCVHFPEEGTAPVSDTLGTHCEFYQFQAIPKWIKPESKTCYHFILDKFEKGEK